MQMKHMITYESFSSDEVVYDIDYSGLDGNIKVLASINHKNVGVLSIKDDRDLEYDAFDIVSAIVHENYRRRGIYLGMIKHFLKYNNANVKSLISQKEPDFDDRPRTADADMFWKFIHKNQKKLGIIVDKIGQDYEISIPKEEL